MARRYHVKEPYRLYTSVVRRVHGPGTVCLYEPGHDSEKMMEHHAQQAQKEEIMLRATKHAATTLIAAR